MPAQQRRRLDEGSQTPGLREHPPQSRQDRPVSRFECWPRDLAPEDRHLVPQHRNLDDQLAALASEFDG